MRLARRAQSISGSASLALIARVAELRAQGVDVISLAAGEPDFPSPPEAIEAAKEYDNSCGGETWVQRLT